MPDGRAMIEHVADALRPLADRLVVLGDCAGFDPRRIGAEKVADRMWGIGPIAGIEALLSSAMAPAYLVATCDTPFLTRGLVAALADDADGPQSATARCLRSDAGEEFAPFPCRIEGTLHGLFARRVREALREAGIRWCTVPADSAWRIRGVNTQEELQEAIRRASSQFPIA